MKRCFLAVCLLTPLLATGSETPVAALQFSSDGPSTCTFDKQSSPLQQQGGMWATKATVHCQHQHPFTLFTTLTPPDDQSSPVSLYLSTSGTCQGARLDSQHPATFTAQDGGVQLHFCVRSDQPFYGTIPVSVGKNADSHGLPARSLTHTVHFAHDSDAIAPEVERDLRALLSQFGPHRDYQFDLYAHASVVGDAKYNLDLSLMRLAAVRHWLIQQGGIAKTQTWGQAYGNQRPANVFGEALEKMASDNRRVEMVIYPRDSTPVVEAKKAQRIHISDQPQ